MIIHLEATKYQQQNNNQQQSRFQISDVCFFMKPNQTKPKFIDFCHLHSNHIFSFFLFCCCYYDCWELLIQFIHLWNEKSKNRISNLFRFRNFVSLLFLFGFSRFSLKRKTKFLFSYRNTKYLCKQSIIFFCVKIW